MTEPVHHVEPLITADQAAAILGMGIEWVRLEAREGRLPSYKFGKFRRFRASELEDFIRASAEGKMAIVTPIARRR